MVPNRPIMPLAVGKAIHEGLFTLFTDDKTLDDAVKRAVDSFYSEVPKLRLPGDDEEYTKQEEMIRTMIPAYKEHWQEAIWKPLGNEIPGTVPVGHFIIDRRTALLLFPDSDPDGRNTNQEGDRIWNETVEVHCFLRCRIDKLVVFRNDLYIVDHKTMARLDMRDIQKYASDFQMTAYVYAASKLIGKRVRGVIVDALVKTKIPQFHREAFFRSDDQLAEWEFEFTEWCRRILDQRVMKIEREAANPNVTSPGKFIFLKNDSECFKYRSCPYYNLDFIGDTPTQRQAFIRREPDYVDDERLLTAKGSKSSSERSASVSDAGDSGGSTSSDQPSSGGDPL